MTAEPGPTLVEFLTARLDEDEATARAASPGPWSSRDINMPEYHIYGNYGWYVRGPSGSPEVEDTEQGKADVDHIARHDPARVLREVEAKRRIVADYADACEKYRDDRTEFRAGERFAALLAATRLAAVYADHQDYREEWKP